jgi:cation diffusion facilitator family transporter
VSREKDIYKVTLVGSVVNVLLTAFKFVAGIVGNSAAMVADAVHSLSDLLTDAVVIIFVHISGKPADKGHDYGHGKYETLATTLIGMALLVVAGGIIYHGALNLLHWLNGENLPKPGMLALWAAVISIVLKELTFLYTVRQGRKLGSQAVEANAWHHRSDALSSIGTLVGIAGAILLGNRWTVLDPLASIIVGLFIIHAAWKLLKQSIGELMEASLPQEVENEILDIANGIPGVTDPHDLRTRRIGSHYAIEFHIRMDGNLPLVEAHTRTSQVENAIKEHFGPDTHVIVHIEPIKPSDND